MSPQSGNWSAKLPVLIGMGALIALLAGFGSWGVFTKIAGAVIVSGRVEVDQNRQVVQHLEGGVVAAVLTHEGAYVQQGQVLIALDAHKLEGQLTFVEARLFEALAQSARLQALREDTPFAIIDPLLAKAADRSDVEALIAGQRDLLDNTRTVHALADAQLRTQLTLYDTQREALQSQQRATHRLLSLLVPDRALSKDIGQRSDRIDVADELARLTEKLADIAAQIAALDARKSDIKVEHSKLTSRLKQKTITQLNELHGKIVRLREERKNLLDRIDRMQITAPVSGHIFGLRFATRSAIVQPAETILSIVPDGRPMVIAARIEPVHIDEVFLQQDVMLRFSAFDRRSTPELKGNISAISNDVFIDDRTLKRFYRIEITLDQEDISTLNGLTLVPGMPVDAFIHTNTRSLLAYLVEPIADYFYRAFRET